jgi:hypothetical protein
MYAVSTLSGSKELHFPCSEKCKPVQNGIFNNKEHEEMAPGHEQ